MDVRDAEPAEFDWLVRLWRAGWTDAHARIVPPELARLRALEDFTARMRKMYGSLRVIGPPGEPLGFHAVKDDELDQLYVSAEARGTDAAAALLRDAESRLAARGTRTAWLACAIGNERAARFYEKHGWRRTGTVTHHPDTREGPFSLRVWRYEKSLLPSVIELRGACLCGKVRYEVRGPPRQMYYCHCRMCRKATGTSFATNMLVRAEDFVILSGREALKPYRSSPGERRQFCAECGSPVFSEAEHRRGILSIRCGLLEADPGIRPAHHLYVDYKAPWFDIHDGLPQFREGAPEFHEPTPDVAQE